MAEATVGIRELRNQVAAVVRRAHDGERIIVTVDGVPTAQLGPISPAGQPTLADLIAAGLLMAPRATRPSQVAPVSLGGRSTPSRRDT